MKYILRNLIVRRDTFQIFYSWFDKANKCEKLEMVTFDRGGRQLGENKLIDFSEGKNERKAGGFSVINWKARNEFLSYGYKYRKDTDYINIDHFDYLGNKTRTEDIVLSDEEGNIEYSFLDDSCNLCHLTRSKRGNRNVKWAIRIYSPDSKQPQVVLLEKPSSEKIYLTNFFREYKDKKNCINLLSSYMLTPSSGTAEGLYIARLDPQTHTLISENVIPFKREKQNPEDEIDFSLSSCIIQGIIPLSNGGLRVIFESRLRIINKLYGITVDNDYQISNIITMDVDSNNTVTEIHKIKKQQEADESSFKYSGFSILNYHDQSYFIYNELSENLDRTPDKMKKINLSRIDKTSVIYATVDNHQVLRRMLIDKSPDAVPNAVLPYRCLTDSKKGEAYILRKMNQDIYLTKIFVAD